MNNPDESDASFIIEFVSLNIKANIVNSGSISIVIMFAMDLLLFSNTSLIASYMNEPIIQNATPSK